MNFTKRGPLIYMAVVTLLAVGVIGLNALLGMRIPFKVHFLIGFVGAALVFVVWHAVLTKGWRLSLVMFAASFVVAFTAEALGVNFGLIFGRYYYTPVLGVQLWGVPLLAALAWEPIAYAAFSLTEALSPDGLQTAAGPRRWLGYAGLAALGALATTAWDLMIDPIAVSQGWWVWVEGGAYMPYVQNGVPVSNYLGWLGVAFTINLLYRGLVERWRRPVRPAPELAIDGPLVLYAALFLTAAGVTLTVLQRPEAALVGLMGMGPFIFMVWLWRARR
jgi:putative membrane protein